MIKFLKKNSGEVMLVLQGKIVSQPTELGQNIKKPAL